MLSHAIGVIMIRCFVLVLYMWLNDCSVFLSNILLLLNCAFFIRHGSKFELLFVLLFELNLDTRFDQFNLLETTSF